MGKQSTISARAPSQRQLRVGEHIRRQLADIIDKVGLADPAVEGIPITVSEVSVSPDLRHATVYVMPLGGQQSEAVLQALRNRSKPIRGQLGKGLRLRSVPELRFELDRSFEQADHMNKILTDLVPDPSAPNPSPESSGEGQG